MTIQVGDKVPAAIFKVMTDEGPKDLTSDEVFGGKKVVFFAVPGALLQAPMTKASFTAIQAMVSTPLALIASELTTNPGKWVIEQPGVKAQNADEILMLADGNGEFTSAIGLELDASGFGMGTRALRFGMIVDNCTVSHLAIEAPGEIKASSAEAMLEAL
jgi:peroxiredoxin